SKNPANRYENCVDFVGALAVACNASGNWVPLPRGASHNMPTAGSGEGLAGTLGATVAENLAETIAAPRVTPAPLPRERRVLPPTEEMRLPKYDMERHPAAKKPPEPAPAVFPPRDGPSPPSPR